MERRTFLPSSFLTALAADVAEASPIDPKETLVLRNNDIKFAPWNGLPPGSGETAELYGDFNKPEPYLVLMKWNPGWFSAPHSYATDRIQMVLSGTWWVASGADFDPKSAVPAPAGSFVKRTARTFHYDGVPSGTGMPSSSRSSASGQWTSSWRIRICPHGAASEDERGNIAKGDSHGYKQRCHVREFCLSVAPIAQSPRVSISMDWALIDEPN
jgi:hypothetical protein